MMSIVDGHLNLFISGFEAIMMRQFNASHIFSMVEQDVILFPVKEQEILA